MISMADYKNLFIDVLLTVLAELSAKSIRIDKNDKAIKSKCTSIMQIERIWTNWYEHKSKLLTTPLIETILLLLKFVFSAINYQSIVMHVWRYITLYETYTKWLCNQGFATARKFASLLYMAGNQQFNYVKRFRCRTDID